MTLPTGTPMTPALRGPIRRRTLHRATFIAAGLYNLAWAAYSALDPQWLMRLADMPPANYPQIFACLAMVVGVYGFIYLEVARVPERGFVLAAVGLLGKVAGPIGMAYLIFTDAWPPAAGWLCLTNDLVWWIPFGLYLHDAWPYFRDDLQGDDTPRPATSDGPRAGTAVYTSLLGARFETLAPPLRALHGRLAVRAEGRFDIGRESGLWPWFLAVTSPLPTNGGQIDIVLSLTTVGPYQIWSRTMGGRPMISVQHARGDGVVAERFGPLEVKLTVDVVDGELRHQSGGFSLCLGPLRVPIPGLLAPGIQARVWAEDDPEIVNTQVELVDRRGRRLMWYGGAVRICETP